MTAPPTAMTAVLIVSVYDPKAPSSAATQSRLHAPETKAIARPSQFSTLPRRASASSALVCAADGRKGGGAVEGGRAARPAPWPAVLRFMAATLARQSSHH